MIKHISIIHRPTGMTREEHVDYWLNVHAPLVRRSLPGMRKYVVNIAVNPENNGEPTIDGVAETHFDSMQSLLVARSSPIWLTEERKASSNKVIDYSRVQGYYLEEHIIPLEE